MERAQRTSLAILLLLLLCCQETAAEYVRLCTLHTSKVFPAKYDRYSGAFDIIHEDGGNNSTVVGGNNNNITDGGSRHLIDLGPSVNDGTVFYVRQCQCSTRPWEKEIQAYCPLDKSTCGIPRSPGEPVGCFNQSSRTSLIRNAWPVIVLWYAGLLIFLMFTTQGRNARHFVWRKCCNSNLNEHLVEQYWYIEGGFWRRRRRPRAFPSILRDVRQRAHERREQEHEVPALPPNTIDHLVDTTSDHHAPNQLALKTKRYVAPRNANVQDDDDLACTICFSPLEDGDRVGALPCSHSFHVDCLKEWLKRRNVCPLCQEPNIAAPQYHPHESLVNEGERDDETGDQQDDTQQTSEEEPSRQSSPPQAEERTGIHLHHRDVFGVMNMLQQQRRR